MPGLLTGKDFWTKSAVFISLSVFLFFLAGRVLLVFFPHPDIGGVEGNVVYFIQRIVDGQAFYTDPAEAPYAIAQYSPFYYWLCSALCKAAGVDADNVIAVYTVGRIFSLLLNLLLVVVVYRFCRKIYDVPPSRSMIASAASFIFLQPTSFARPDSLYHVFFFMGLYYFFLFCKKEKQNVTGTLLFAAALFSVLALFSKQTAFILPLIFGAWLLYTKKIRHLLVFTAVYLALFFLLLLIISSSTGLAPFLKNTLQGINNGVSIGWYIKVVLVPLIKGVSILFLLFSLVLFVLVKKDRHPLTPVSMYVSAILFLLLNVIALKLGSSPGYLTEWWTFLFILVAFYWPLFSRLTDKAGHVLPGTVVLLALLIHAGLQIPAFTSTLNAISSPAKMHWYNKEKEVAEKIKGQLKPGEEYCVFTNIYTPDSYLSNFLFRHAVMPQMEITALSTYPDKKYDYTGFEKGLQDGRFRLMIKKQTDTVSRFFNISLNGYQPADTSSGYIIYQYKKE